MSNIVYRKSIIDIRFTINDEISLISEYGLENITLTFNATQYQTSSWHSRFRSFRHPDYFRYRHPVQGSTAKTHKKSSNTSRCNHRKPLLRKFNPHPDLL